MMKKICLGVHWITLARTHSKSGLKSQVLKLTFFELKMMVKEV